MTMRITILSLVGFALLPLALIAAIALSGSHLVWLALPLFFFFVVRPLLWRSRGHGCGRGISLALHDPGVTGGSR